MIAAAGPAAARSTPASSAVPAAFWPGLLGERQGAGACFVPLLQRAERAHADGIDVGRLDARALHGGARELDGLAPLAALEVEAGEHARGIGGGVVDAHGLAQLRDRAVEVTELPGGEPGQVARAGVVGPIADALFERRERRLGISALELDAAANQPCVRRLLEILGHLFGAVELFEIDQHVGVREAQLVALVARELEHLLDRGERLLRLPGSYDSDWRAGSRRRPI